MGGKKDKDWHLLKKKMTAFHGGRGRTRDRERERGRASEREQSEGERVKESRASEGGTFNPSGESSCGPPASSIVTGGLQNREKRRTERGK